MDDVQWPISKPRNRVPQILLGVLAVLFVFGVAGASYYISSQLSSRQAVAPTAPESEPEASAGCKDKKGKSKCKSNETCVNNVCKLKSVVNPTATAYRCTSANCPGPAFYCSSSTNCANSPGWEGGQPKPTTVTSTPASSCTPGQPCTTSQGTGTCKRIGEGFSGNYCDVMPGATGGDCGSGYSCTTDSNAACNASGGRPGSCRGANDRAGICCMPSSVTGGCNLGQACTTSSGAGTCRAAGPGQPNYCQVTITSAPTSSTSGGGTCGSGYSCTTDSNAACNASGGRPGSCRGANDRAGICCMPSSAPTSVAGGGSTTTTGGGGGGGGGNGGGGGGGGGGGAGTTTVTTPAPTTTIPPVIAGACMEIQMYSQRTDGTFNTTPMTTNQRNSVKIGDKIRLVVTGSKANLLAKFRITVGTADPVEIFSSTYLDTAKLKPYYDYTIANTGNYTFQGFVSSAPSPVTCGGIAGVLCPSGYTCNLPRNIPDASGICIPQSQK